MWQVANDDPVDIDTLSSAARELEDALDGLNPNNQDQHKLAYVRYLIEEATRILREI